ncbi:hypothetical protein V5O48_014154 [Marasmius crinis-equi]|uniref:Uncharacterized protein n=1 Tax=Marasmius crinis-equi TaxID=585013 RepID=A0ABR3EY45_9AGAR
MPRLRLHHTPEEKREAHQASSLKYFHKNREWLNMQRHERQKDKELAVPDVSLKPRIRQTQKRKMSTGRGDKTSHQRDEKKKAANPEESPRIIGAACARKKCSVEPFIKNTLARPVNWASKPQKLKRILVSIIGGEGDNCHQQFYHDTYNQHISALQEQKPSTLILDHQRQMELLVAAAHQYESGILQELGARVWRELEAVKAELQAALFCLTEMWALEMVGIEELITAYRRKELPFQK